MGHADNVPHGTVVSSDPVDWTPHVLNGAGKGIAKVGSTIVVGGKFTDVSTADGTSTFPRTNLFAFNASTGAISRRSRRRLTAT